VPVTRRGVGGGRHPSMTGTHFAAMQSVTARFTQPDTALPLPIASARAGPMGDV